MAELDAPGDDRDGHAHGRRPGPPAGDHRRGRRGRDRRPSSRPCAAIGCDEAQGIPARPARPGPPARTPRLITGARPLRVSEPAAGQRLSRANVRRCAGRAWGTRRPAGRRRPRSAGSGRWVAATGTRSRISPGATAPSVSPAIRAAPRRLASSGFGHLLDGAAEHAGVDRAPRRRGGAAADGPERAERSADEPLDALGQPAGVEGHPLEDGPGQLGPGRPQRQVVEPGPGRPVVDRRALAGQPRGEEHPAAARRGGGRQRRQLVERRDEAGRRVAAPRHVPEPLERPPAGLLVVGHQAQAGQDARAPWPSGGRRRSSSSGTGS